MSQSDDTLGLQLYHGKWLTEGEILYSEVFEDKHRKRHEEQQAKNHERSIMAERSLKMQQAADQVSKVKKAPPAPEPAPKVEPKKELPPPSAATPVAQVAAPVAKIQKLDSRTKPVESTAMDVDDDAAEQYVPTFKAAAASSAVSQKPAKIIKKKTVTTEVDLEEEAERESGTDPENLFSPAGIISDTIWKSNTHNAESQQFLLPGFSYTEKQTLALRLTVPNDANSWSINVCPARDWHNQNVLLHFNPRYKKRTVVMTDKQGTWNAGRSRHFGDSASSKTDGLLAKEIDLMIQIRSDGFYIFANDMYNCFFTHRRDPTTTSVDNVSKKTTDLKLIVNARDANGNALDLILHKVWWGRRDPQKNALPPPVQVKVDRQASEERIALARTVPFQQRSLMIRGLPEGVFDLKECQAIEFALTEVFAEYVVEDMSVVPGQGYGFIRFESADSVQPAIKDLDGAEIVLSENEAQGGSVLQLTPMVL